MRIHYLGALLLAMMGGSLHLDVVVTEPIDLAIAADVVFDDALRSASLVLDDEYQYRIDLATGAIE